MGKDIDNGIENISTEDLLTLLINEAFDLGVLSNNGDTEIYTQKLEVKRQIQDEILNRFKSKDSK